MKVTSECALKIPAFRVKVSGWIRLLGMALLPAFFCLSGTTLFAATVYVDASRADDSGNGQSWATAKKSLSAAISAAAANDEIWMKKGTYSNAGEIAVAKAVKIYGGFAGTETALAQRTNIAANETILKQSNTTASETNRVLNITASVTLDGLTVTGGRLASSTVTLTLKGGGIYAAENIVIENCKITDNAIPYNLGVWSASNAYGGGVYAEKEIVLRNTAIMNCWVEAASTGTSTLGGGNHNAFGGGVYANGKATVEDCVFSGCTLFTNGDSSSGAFANTVYGGALYLGGAVSSVKNTVINGTTTRQSATAIAVQRYNGANCSAAARGAGVYVAADNVVLDSVRVSNCSLDVNNGTIVSSANSAKATEGGGIYVAGVNAAIQNSTLEKNTGLTGGGIYLNSASVVRKCLIVGNSALLGGGDGKTGGGIYLGAAGSTIEKSMIVANKSLTHGAGISTLASPWTTLSKITNCVIAHNETMSTLSSNAAGCLVWNNKFEITNCTFAQNKSAQSSPDGVDLYASGANVLIRNCIFWNTGTIGSSVNVAGANINYCASAQTGTGTNSITDLNSSNTNTLGPNFVNPSLTPGLLEWSDAASYMLAPTSRLTNKGNFTAGTTPADDIRNVIRSTATPSIGAYEYQETDPYLVFSGLSQYTGQVVEVTCTPSSVTPVISYHSSESDAKTGINAIPLPSSIGIYWVRADVQTRVGSYPPIVQVAQLKVNASLAFVTVSGAGDFSGSSWSNAMKGTDLPNAVANGAREFWIAKGTYTSSQAVNAFDVPAGKKLYGGFAGTETSLSQRTDIHGANKTILTKGPQASTRILNLNNNAVADGFSITGGATTGVVGGSPTEAGTSGAGVSMTVNSVLRNCKVYSNTSANTFGGGISMRGTNSWVDGCEIYSNAANANGGGGIVTWSPVSGYKITHSIIRDNTTAASGGGILIAGSTTIQNCSFLKNSANGGTGGGIHNGVAGTRVENCIVAANTASVSNLDNGAGIFTINAATSYFINCLIAHNRSADGSGAARNGWGVGICAQNNSAPANNKVINCTIVKNQCGDEGTRTGAQFVECINTILSGNSRDDGTAAAQLHGSATAANNLIGVPALYTWFKKSDNVLGPSGWTGNAADYSLTPAAAVAIDKGTSSSAPAYDLVYAKRPLGAGYDIGAYEYILSGDTGYLTFSNLVQSAESVTPVVVGPLPANPAVRYFLTEADAKAGNNAIALPQNGGSYWVRADVAGQSANGYPDVTAYAVLKVVNSRVYFSPEGAGNHSGSDWANAAPGADLQSLLNVSLVEEVWLKKGIYTAPTREYNGGTDWGLNLNAAKKVYGGFAGTETSLADRRITGNPTIIRHAGQNGVALRVMTAQGSTAANPSIIDGLTLDGLGVPSSGLNGGVLVLSAPAIVRNCRIINGSVDNKGGGLYVASADCKIEKCDFINNQATLQGGGAAVLAQSEITNCIFLNNRSAEGGGAVRSENNATRFTNCLMANNSSGKYGGAVDNAGGTFINCTIVNNKSETGEGGVGDNSGGGVFNRSDATTMLNCVLWGNTITQANKAAEQYVVFGGTVNFTTSAVQDKSGVPGVLNLSPNNLLSNGPGFIAPTSASGVNVSGWNTARWAPFEGVLLKAGTAAGAPAADINGRTRGTPPDIGAYEYAAGDTYLTFSNLLQVIDNLKPVTVTPPQPETVTIEYYTDEACTPANKIPFSNLSVGKFRVKVIVSANADNYPVITEYADLIIVSPRVCVTPDGKMPYGASPNTPWAFSVPGSYLQTAMNLDSVREVWVAGGTYAFANQLRQDIASFNLPASRKIYGSFKGDETDPAARERLANGKAWEFVNPTTLIRSGYISAAARVLTFANGTAQNPTLADGLILSGGNPLQNQPGAGVYMQGVNTVLENCQVINNSFRKQDANDPSFANGGGVYVSGGKVLNCRISGNKADKGGWQGGYGAGVYAAGAALIQGCQISNNSADRENSNQPGALGGGIYIAGSGTVVDDCDVFGNSLGAPNSTGQFLSASGAGIYVAADAVIQNSRIKKNMTTGTNNAYSGKGAGLYLAAPSKVIGCEITGNIAGTSGGGIHAEAPSEVSNSVIAANTSLYSAPVGNGVYSGAGLYLSNVPHRVFNCIIANNELNPAVVGAGWGAAVSSPGMIPEVTNCTIVRNEAKGQLQRGVVQGGFYRNCIFWGNTNAQPGVLIYAGYQVNPLSRGNVADIGNGLQGVDSVYTKTIPGDDPSIFIAPSDSSVKGASGYDSNANWGLKTGNVCINGGVANGAPAYDIVGTVRPLNGGYDVGAYQAITAGDLYLTFGNLSQAVASVSDLVPVTVHPAASGAAVKYYLNMDDAKVPQNEKTLTQLTVPGVYVVRADVNPGTAGYPAVTQYAALNVYKIPAADADGFYHVSNWPEFQWFTTQIQNGNKAIKGRLTGNFAIPKGANYVPPSDFSGQFTGLIGPDQGPYYTITVDADINGQNAGLFASSSNARFENIRVVVNGNISGLNDVGGLVGYAQNTYIVNCAVEVNGKIQSSQGGAENPNYRMAGGLVADVWIDAAPYNRINNNRVVVNASGVISASGNNGYGRNVGGVIGYSNAQTATSSLGEGNSIVLRKGAALTSYGGNNTLRTSTILGYGNAGTTLGKVWLAAENGGIFPANAGASSIQALNFGTLVMFVNTPFELGVPALAGAGNITVSLEGAAVLSIDSTRRLVCSAEGRFMGTSLKVASPEGAFQPFNLPLNIYCYAADEGIRYVTLKGGSEVQDGMSWETAYADVNGILQALADPNCKTVRVGGGTYTLTTTLTVPAAKTISGAWMKVGSDSWIQASARISQISSLVAVSPGIVYPWEFQTPTVFNAASRINPVVSLNGTPNIEEQRAIVDAVTIQNGAQGVKALGRSSVLRSIIQGNSGNANNTLGEGVGIGLYGDNVVIDKSLIYNNVATSGEASGAIGVGRIGTATGARISNCFVIANTGTGGGGGAFGSQNSSGGWMTLEQCLVANNSAGDACFRTKWTGSANIVANSCTIVNNGGAAGSNAAGTLNFNDCLIYGNGSAAAGCGITRCWGQNGTAITSNPFVVEYATVGLPATLSDALTKTYWQLKGEAGCVNQGNNAAVETYGKDITGINNRIRNFIADVGAYESNGWGPINSAIVITPVNAIRNPGRQYYTTGDTVLMTANPPSGQIFVSWTYTAGVTPLSDITDSAVVFVVTSNTATTVTITANCRQNVIGYMTVNGAGDKSGTSWANAADSAALNTWLGASGAKDVIRLGGTSDSAGAIYSPLANAAANTAYEINRAVVLSGGWNPVTGLQDSSFRTTVTRSLDSDVRIFHIKSNNVVLDRLVITGGLAPAGQSGGGILTDNDCKIQNCIIAGNATLSADGGGVMVGGTATTLTNCLIAHNSAGINSKMAGAGVMANELETPLSTLYNCTVVGNWSNSESARTGVQCVAAYNTILWGNGSNTSVASNSGNQGYRSFLNKCATLAMYTVAGGSTLNSLTLSITNSANNGPRFVSPGITAGAAGWSNLLNYTLQDSSMLINAGSNAFVFASNTSDLVGNDRIYLKASGGVADMGAYESAYKGKATIAVTHKQKVYNGSVQGFTVTATGLDGANVPVSVTYVPSNPILPGTYSGTVVASSPVWTGSVSDTLVINKIVLAADSVRINYPVDTLYKPDEPKTFAVTVDFMPPGQGWIRAANPLISYNGKQDTPTLPGYYRVDVILQETLYNGTALGGFTVVTEYTDPTVEFESSTLTFNNLYQTTLKVTALKTGTSTRVTLVNGIDYKADFWNMNESSTRRDTSLDRGTYNVNVKAPGLFPGSGEVYKPSAYPIAPYALQTGDIVFDQATLRYPSINEYSRAPSLTTRMGWSVTAKDYTLAITKAGVAVAPANVIEPGDYIFTYTFTNGNYTGTATATLTIVAQAKVYVTPNGQGGQTGIDWSNAAPQSLIQPALNTSGVTTVCLGGGTYPLSTTMTVPTGKTLEGGYTVNGASAARTRPLSGAIGPVVYPWEFASASVLRSNGFTNSNFVLSLGGVVDGVSVTNGATGGITLTANGAVVRNSIVRSNTIVSNTGLAAGIYCRGGNQGTVSDFIIESTLVADNAVTGNFSGSYAADVAGGIGNNSFGGATMTRGTVRNSMVVNNKSVNGPGGIGFAVRLAGDTCLILNSLIANNETALVSTDENGSVCGGVASYFNAPVGNLSVVNCTIANNRVTANVSGDQSGGVSRALLSNTIVYGNVAGTTPAPSNTVNLATNSSANFTGDVNPRFVNPNPAAGNDPNWIRYDWSLIQGSPCVNVGRNALSQGTSDLTGTARIKRKVVDLGAYESNWRGGIQLIVSDTTLPYSGNAQRITWRTIPADIHDLCVDTYVDKDGHPVTPSPSVIGSYTAYISFPGNDDWESLHVSSPFIIDRGYRCITPAGAGLKDGSSWDNAAGTDKLNAMINESVRNGKIYMKGGVYNLPQTLLMKSQVTLYGGCTGTENVETPGAFDPDARPKSDWNANALFEAWEFSDSTVLNAGSLFRAVDFDGSDSAVVDGVFITGGVTQAADRNGSGSGVYLGRSSTLTNSAVTNCTANAVTSGSSATRQGGAVFFSADGASLLNTFVYGNSATGISQGTVCVTDVTATIANCIIANNRGSDNGSVWTGSVAFADNAAKVSHLVNTLVAKNKGGLANGCGGLRSTSANINVANSIFWGNERGDAASAGELGISTATFFNNASTDAVDAKTVYQLNSDNTNIFGARFNRPTAVAGIDPNAATADWSLAPASLLINRGLTAAFPASLNQRDVAGRARIFNRAAGGIIDLGPYEYQGAGFVFGAFGNLGPHDYSNTPIAATFTASTANGQGSTVLPAHHLRYTGTRHPESASAPSNADTYVVQTLWPTDNANWYSDTAALIIQPKFYASDAILVKMPDPDSNPYPAEGKYYKVQSVSVNPPVIGEAVLREGIDYRVGYVRNGVILDSMHDIGTYEITITLIGNYAGAKPKYELTLEPTWLYDSYEIDNSVQVVYNGKPRKDVIEVDGILKSDINSRIPFTVGEQYTFEYCKNNRTGAVSDLPVDAGSYDFKISFFENFLPAKEYHDAMTIYPYSVERVDVTVNGLVNIYDGKPKPVTVAFANTPSEMVKGRDYQVYYRKQGAADSSISAPVNNGFYTVIIECFGNYYSQQMLWDYSIAAGRFVTVTGAGDRSGMDWENAYPADSLYGLLRDNTIPKIFVGAGIYSRPTTAAEPCAWFIADGVTLYGGYPANPAGSPDRILHDKDHRAVLTRSGSFGRVVTILGGAEGTSTACLDGIDITGGYLDAPAGAEEGISGAGVHMVSGGILRNCAVYNNVISGKTTTTSAYGAGVWGEGLGHLIENSYIVNNYLYTESSGAVISGAGVFMRGDASNALKGVLVANNTVRSAFAPASGGGIGTNGALTLEYCTVTANTVLAPSVSSVGGGVISSGNSPKLISSVIWGNGSSKDSQWSVKTAVADNVAHSAVQETVLAGNSNINLSASNNAANGPNFTAPQAQSVWGYVDNRTADELIDADGYRLGNYTLNKGSVLVDAGTRDPAIMEDIIGQPRPQGYTYDIGAFELEVTPVQPIPYQGGVFVKADAPLDGSGNSWDDAYQNLAQAVAYAASGTVDIRRIYVAAGTYYVSLDIPQNLTIIGGFPANITGRAVTGANPVKNQTVLNAEGNKGTVVLFRDNMSQISELNGFVVTGGYDPESSAGGVKLTNNSRLINSFVVNNRSAEGVGGVSAGGNAFIVNSVIANNTGSAAGGVRLSGSASAVFSTVVNNTSDSHTQIAAVSGSIVNSIVWADDISAKGITGTPASVNNTLVVNGYNGPNAAGKTRSLSPENSNINGPQFIAPSLSAGAGLNAPTLNGWRFYDYSVARQVATPLGSVPNDIEGNPRLSGDDTRDCDPGAFNAVRSSIFGTPKLTISTIPSPDISEGETFYLSVASDRPNPADTPLHIGLEYVTSGERISMPGGGDPARSLSLGKGMSSDSVRLYVKPKWGTQEDQLIVQMYGLPIGAAAVNGGRVEATIEDSLYLSTVPAHVTVGGVSDSAVVEGSTMLLGVTLDTAVNPFDEAVLINLRFTDKYQSRLIYNGKPVASNNRVVVRIDPGQLSGRAAVSVTRLMGEQGELPLVAGFDVSLVGEVRPDYVRMSAPANIRITDASEPKLATARISLTPSTISRGGAVTARVDLSAANDSGSTLLLPVSFDPARFTSSKGAFEIPQGGTSATLQLNSVFYIGGDAENQTISVVPTAASAVAGSSAQVRIEPVANVVKVNLVSDKGQITEGDTVLMTVSLTTVNSSGALLPVSLEYPANGASNWVNPPSRVDIPVEASAVSFVLKSKGLIGEQLSRDAMVSASVKGVSGVDPSASVATVRIDDDHVKVQVALAALNSDSETDSVTVVSGEAFPVRILLDTVNNLDTFLYIPVVFTDSSLFVSGDAVRVAIAPNADSGVVDVVTAIFAEGNTRYAQLNLSALPAGFVAKTDSDVVDVAVEAGFVPSDYGIELSFEPSVRRDALTVREGHALNVYAIPYYKGFPTLAVADTTLRVTVSNPALFSGAPVSLTLNLKRNAPFAAQMLTAVQNSGWQGPRPCRFACAADVITATIIDNPDLSVSLYYDNSPSTISKTVTETQNVVLTVRLSEDNRSGSPFNVTVHTPNPEYFSAGLNGSEAVITVLNGNRTGSVTLTPALKGGYYPSVSTEFKLKTQSGVVMLNGTSLTIFDAVRAQVSISPNAYRPDTASSWIVWNDSVRVKEGGQLRMSAKLNETVKKAFTLPVVIGDSSLIVSDSLVNGRVNVPFAAETDSNTFLLNILKTPGYQGMRTVSLTVADTGILYLTQPNPATVTVYDGNDPYVAFVSQNPDSKVIEGSPIFFQFRLLDNLGSDLVNLSGKPVSIPVKLSGDLTQLVDSRIELTVQIAPNTSRADLTLATFARLGVQKDRQVIVSVDTARFTTLPVKPEVQSVKIVDDPAFKAVLTLTSTPSVNEGGMITLNASLSRINNSDTPISVNVALSSSTDPKYPVWPQTSVTLVIPVGSNAAAVNLRTQNANGYFAVRTAQAKLPAQSPYDFVRIGVPSTAVTTVNGQKVNPTVAFLTPVVFVNEPKETLEAKVSVVMVRTAGALDEALFVPFRLSGSAIETKNFSLSAREFVFKSGATVSDPVIITVVNDRVNNPDLTVIFNAYAAEGKFINIDPNGSSFTLLIRNTNPDPVVEKVQFVASSLKQRMGESQTKVVSVSIPVSKSTVTATISAKAVNGIQKANYTLLDLQTLEPIESSVFDLVYAPGTTTRSFLVSPVNNLKAGEPSIYFSFRIMTSNAPINSAASLFELEVYDDDPYANTDYVDIRRQAGSTDSMREINPLANDLPYDQNSVNPAVLSLDSVYPAQTAAGAVVTMLNGKVYYDYSKVSDKLFLLGTQDTVYYRLAQAGAGQTEGIIRVTLSHAYTQGSTYEIPESVIQKLPPIQKKPVMGFVYQDPFKIRKGEFVQRKLKLKLLNWTRFAPDTLISLVPRGIRLYNPKEFNAVARRGLFYGDEGVYTNRLIQSGSLGGSIEITAKGADGKWTKTVGSMIMIPPKVNTIGVNEIRSNVITDYSGRQYLMVSGSYFGDKPTVYVQYLKGSRTVLKKLRIIKFYIDVEGNRVDVSAVNPDQGSRVYVELPGKPLNPSSKRYDIVVFSGIGYGSSVRVPLELINPIFE